MSDKYIKNRGCKSSAEILRRTQSNPIRERRKSKSNEILNLNDIDLNDSSSSCSFASNHSTRSNKSAINVNHEDDIMEDDVESGTDNVNLFDNKKFINNISSKYPHVRQYFEIEKKEDKNKIIHMATCLFDKNCKRIITMNNNSDINLRSHLGLMHGYTDVLTEGQKRKRNLIDSSCSKEEKSKIDDAIVKCICEDSRPFSDFSKPGMRELLKILKPGYKPISRNSIKKGLKKK